jgi:hypothetical protein
MPLYSITIVLNSNDKKFRNSKILKDVGVKIFLLFIKK